MADIYCYPDTYVLKNKLGIHNAKRLAEAETKLVSVRLYQLYEKPVQGRFDFKHLCKIHKHLFKDLYDWAGEPRTVNIAKKSLFCLTEHLQTYAQTIFPAYYDDCMRIKDQPHEFIRVFAKYYADLNALHPFREGNGRSQREFARELCLQCGYGINLLQTNRDEMLQASIESLDRGDNTRLEAVFKKCLMPLQN